MCREIHISYNEKNNTAIKLIVLLVHLNKPDVKESKGHLCLHSKAFGLLPGAVFVGNLLVIYNCILGSSTPFGYFKNSLYICLVRQNIFSF